MKKRMQHMAGQFRTVLLTFVVFLLIALCAFMVMSCSNDEADDILADYKYVLCEVTTDANRHLATLRYDDGSERTITTDAEASTPDSLYRVEALVLEDPDGQHVALGGLSPVISPLPRIYLPQQQKRDPVDVVTLWRTPRYVNMRLAIPRGGSPHGIGFSDDGCVQHANGSRTRCISLFHDQNGDPAHYRAEYLLSCPVYQYADELTQGRDSIRFVIYTSDVSPTILTTVY